MTADVVQMHPEEKRRESDDIARRRADAIRSHPSTRSKQLAQVERQQILNALIAAVGDGRLSISDDGDLPLIVHVLLHNCPQVFTHPDVVAKSVEEAAASYADSFGQDAAMVVSSLAAGTAHTAVYGYLMESCSLLRDWLTAAAVAR